LVSVLRSRNARPQKALVGRAQWDINQAVPLEKRHELALKDHFISVDARNRG
jgi:hypothetical protein